MNGQSFGKRGEWYVVIQFLLFALLAFGPEATGALPYWSGVARTISRFLGAPLGIAGAGLLAAGIIYLGHNLTAVPHPKQSAKLVTTGAYALVRHPIYSGIILGALGWSLWKGSTLMVLYTAILLLFFDIKSRREERWLSDKFGEYAHYQQKIRKLIPFVY